MKILHVFTGMNYIYTRALIDLFHNYTNRDKHQFLICDRKNNIPKEILELKTDTSDIYYTDSTFLNYNSKYIKEYMMKNDYTIFHFLPNNVFLHIRLILHPKLLKKTIWRIWGADLYNWEKNGVKGMVLNRIRGYTREKIKYVIAEPMDIDICKKQFKHEKIFLEGPDPKGYDIELLENSKNELKDNKIRILVGHSAVPALNHKYILDKLYKYCKENIEIIIPLSYGDNNYAYEISKYAIELFGSNKIMILNNKLTLNEYAKLLWNCDIAIIYSERQIAMGNITMMMYMKKKIFLMRNSVMDKYYRVNQGLEIYDADRIGNIPYDDFIKGKDYEKNRVFAEHEIDIYDIAEKWNDTFAKLNFINAT